MYLSPRLSVLFIREMSKAERCAAMTNSFQQGLIIASRLPINYRIWGDITTMALHGKSFLCRPYLYASAAFAQGQSSDP
jgi:hypothetical protein